MMMDKMKNINEAEDVYMLTHDDFDGVGSPTYFLNLKKKRLVKARRFEYELVTNNDIQERIRDFALRPKEGYLLVICDHSPTLENYQLLIESGIDFLVFDHHKSSQLKEVADDRVIIDESACATVLFRNYVSKNISVSSISDTEMLKDINDLYSFTDIVNDYDLWIHNYPESKAMNTLLYEIGKEAFIERFSDNPSPVLTIIEESIIDMANYRLEVSVREAINGLVVHLRSGQRYGVTFIKDNQSEIGHRILDKFEEISYVFLINPNTRKVSIRSKEDADAYLIADHYSDLLETNAGGHPRAAGFGVNHKQLCKLLKDFDEDTIVLDMDNFRK